MIKQTSHLFMKQNWIFDCNVWNEFFSKTQFNINEINKELDNFKIEYNKIIVESDKLNKIFGQIPDMNSRNV
jgi:hypothetical protein